jgi:UDP-N-acetylmuramyl tripeptide synthase
MPATRRLLLLGQAGNRDDAQMQALAGSAWQTQAFDRVLLKDMTAMLRGRAPGEVPQMLRAALIEAGAPAHALEIVPSELEGVRAALRWAREGDLLVLGVHVERARVLALMNALGASSWKPGAPLPAP